MDTKVALITISIFFPPSIRQYVVHVLCKFIFWAFVIRAFLKVTGLMEPVNEAASYLLSSIGRGNSTTNVEM